MVKRFDFYFHDAEFNESDHPRNHGKFASSAGGSTGGESSAPKPGKSTGPSTVATWEPGKKIPKDAPYAHDPPAGVLASHTDKDGYTIRIESLTGTGQEDDEYTGKVVGVPRYGQMYIRSPKGDEVPTGKFMNWPERAFKLTNKQWISLPWKERASLEAKQQATAYEPLKKQFEGRKDLLIKKVPKK